MLFTLCPLDTKYSLSLRPLDNSMSLEKGRATSDHNSMSQSQRPKSKGMASKGAEVNVASLGLALKRRSFQAQQSLLRVALLMLQGQRSPLSNSSSKHLFFLLI